jgi:hypothetical protein
LEVLPQCSVPRHPLGFALLTFVIQDSYLEATISVVTVLAWIAATTEAMDLALERYS